MPERRRRQGDPRRRQRIDAERRRLKDRAQTTLDFAIGVSVFLAIVVFVFAFVPGILEPFNLSGEADSALADRVASDLSQAKLGNASEPYVLDSSCAVQFFDEANGPPSHCNYGGGDLNERLGISNIHNLNVTLAGTFAGPDGELACWNSDGKIVGAGSCSGQVLSAGGAPPESNDETVTARRVVSLQQQNLTLKVVVW
jgi:hypothetical protein